MIRLFAIALVAIGLSGSTAYAMQLTGRILEVNTGGNAIKLQIVNPEGKTDDVKLVWDDDLPGLQKLENAKPGDEITVEAEQNAITRNYKVTALPGTAEAMGQAIDDAGRAAAEATGEAAEDAGQAVESAGEATQDAAR